MFTQSQPGKAETIIRIEGLDCPDCTRKLEDSIRELNGVEEAAISFASGKLYLRHSGVLPIVNNLITLKGYRPVEDDRPGEENWTLARTRVIYAALSAFFLLLAAVSSRLYPPAGGALLLAAVLSGGMNTFRRGAGALRLRQLDMNVLMTVAVAGALIIGEWWEAATVAFLFAASNALETYTAEKNRRSIRNLISAAPEVAHRIEAGGTLSTVPVEDILTGEEMLVRPGERIPLDGIVTEGASLVVESAITGESVPQGKEQGDPVYAGTLNGNGSLRVRVTATSKDTTLAKIVRLVEEAQLRRAPALQFADRFARVYTPAVLALAAFFALAGEPLFGGGWQPWLYRSLALLIVACPCALVVATPVTIVAALTNAARHGVLIKGGVYLEQAGQIRAMVFDKTGTLTTGNPSVSGIVTLDGMTEEDVLRAAASLEMHSEHLLARAVRDCARDRGIELLPASEFSSFPGKGVSASVNGTRFHLGSKAFLAEQGVPAAALTDAADNGKTALYLACGTKPEGIILTSDTLRSESRTVLTQLRGLGLAKLAMLTGDREEVALAMAEELELDEVAAGLLPEDKEAAVRRYRAAYGKVAMVGDGINDAPALASADLGIAMGAAGSPTALETADIALMGDELDRLPFMISLSRRTLQIIRQNIFLALLIKAIAVMLVFPGWLTLWLAILADMGASILVTANGMRLLSHKGSLNSI